MANNKFSLQWNNIKAKAEVADIAFVILRAVIFCGGIGWLVFSDISQQTFSNVSNIFIYFTIYSVLLYVWLFIALERKKVVYGFALFFDFIYASLLVSVTGGFDSSFFNGFYLITALYSFYYGLLPGTVIAALAAVMYFFSSGLSFYELHWTDFMVRIAFLFLLAVPLGMLSQKLKSDKNKIEDLNRDLEGYIEELRSVQERLIEVEKLSALGRLTADVAHEIRNPLTSIGGFARRLDNKLQPGTREREYADIVVSEVDRLERILGDVLSFSRETKYDLEYLEINSIVSESVNAFAAICTEQSIKVELETDPSLPEVLIDRDQVKQAMSNLVFNALDVMTEGGRLTVKTYMEVFHQVQYVVVEVSDTGPGLPVEALHMIFEPFYTTKIGVGSTGLGLPICKKIIDEHNGLIFADSELGKGSSFHMYFPYQRKEDGNKIKCWEYMKCGVENAEGAVNMRCPAYPDYGRICWAIAGTFCGKKVNGAIAQKLGNCKKCKFYQHVTVMKDI